MVSGNEFSTFGLRHSTQTDSYYLLKDPEARDANYTAHNSANQKNKTATALLFYCLSQRTGSMSGCVCDRKKDGKKGGKAMKQSAPYVKSDWNILAISHRLAHIIWEA